MRGSPQEIRESHRRSGAGATSAQASAMVGPTDFLGAPSAPRARLSGRTASWRCRASASRDGMLSLNNIEVIYDGVILVLKGVSLNVPRGEDHDVARGQRGREDDDAEGDLGVAALRAGGDHQGGHRAGRRADRPPGAPRGRPARRRAGLRGAARVRAPHHRGEPDRRRPRPGRPLAPAGRHRPRLPVLPAAGRPTPRAVGLPLRRRAADAGHRPRAHVEPEGDPAGRAVAGAGAHAGRRDLRDRPAHEPPGAG